MNKGIKSDIIKQLLFALGSIALSAGTILLISLFSDNGIEAFMLSLFAVPITSFLSSAFSAALLSERNIWFPVVLAAIILGIVYLLGTFGISYFSFALIELSGFAGGYFLGRAIGKKCNHTKTKENHQ